MLESILQTAYFANEKKPSDEDIPALEDTPY